MRIFGITHLALFFNSKLDAAEIVKHYNPIAIVCEITTTNALYERARKKWFAWKLQAKHEVSDIDKRSMIISSVLIDKDDGIVLATMRKKCVFYSLETRTIVNIPEKYKGVKDESLRLSLIYEIPEFIPKDAFSFDYRIMMSDTDYNSHVGHVTYVRLFSDVASLACKADKFSTLKEDICFYETEKLMILYARETFVNDLVRICVWEDSGSPWTVRCAMYCKDKPICYAHANFKLYHIEANP